MFHVFIMAYPTNVFLMAHPTIFLFCKPQARGCTIWLVSKDCSFLWWRTVNRNLAHRGCTFTSCGTPGSVLLEAAVHPMKSAAGIVTIWMQQYDLCIFSAGWLKRQPVQLEVHAAGIRPAQHAKNGAPHFICIKLLYKLMVSQPHWGLPLQETAIVWSQPIAVHVQRESSTFVFYLFKII